ncbi:response regulator [Bordetella avium]|uniref:Two-component system response regulator n=1 Tax=Bordetella avium (strain 197N) TaxID=360910 RepID=Q2L0M1_BORA1|nr:response regulator transcription factor [Bordetella avium]AZY47871.1 DNA-binding response regulator [Bordetella avium]AZY51243.1 DNA-binding response regulator [Bordetella avium]RIQ14902.1 DNA-binding response regulator [Bordetella avium]RIQ18607.1 DNA-binding response regulator [Bordetella avium]RIQ35357.1 DNA-binding response regulator [Bordetella avium]
MRLTRLLLIDDHALVRDGLKLHLQSIPSLTVMGETESARATLDLLARGQPEEWPDLVLLDLSLQDADGLELAKILHERYPRIAVLILSMHDNVESMRQAIAAGVRGYVLKTEATADLLTAIKRVAAGKTGFSPQVSLKLTQNHAPLLTQRERDILQGIGMGMTNRQIAQTLDLSVRTVETYRHTLKRKLNIGGRADLIKYAIEHRRP